MGKLFQKAVYLILALQEKFARKRHAKNLTSFTNTTSKTVMNAGCSLNLTAKTEENKAKLESNIASILKNFENMPEKMLLYIERNGTPVIRHPKASKTPRGRFRKSVQRLRLLPAVLKARLRLHRICESRGQYQGFGNYF